MNRGHTRWSWSNGKRSQVRQRRARVLAIKPKEALEWFTPVDTMPISGFFCRDFPVMTYELDDGLSRDAFSGLWARDCGVVTRNLRDILSD